MSLFANEDGTGHITDEDTANTYLTTGRCSRITITDPLTVISECDGDVTDEGWTTDPYLAMVLADGAFAYWRQGEASGPTAFDSSGHGYHGIYPASNVAYHQPSVSSLVYSTTHSNSAGTNCGSNTILSMRGANGTQNLPMSFELWVKSSANNINGGEYLALKAGTPPDQTGFNVPGWFIQFFSGQLGFVIGDSTEPIGFNGGMVSANSYTDGLWHHLVVTWDGLMYVDFAHPNMLMYVDKIIVATDWANSLLTGISVLPMYIGQRCNASLQDIALYQTVLTPAQIAAHYTERRRV